MNGRAIGLTLISDDGHPLGFGGVYFDKNAHNQDVAIAFFYGGPNQIFARKYLKQALIGMQRVFRRLMELGVNHVYACVDKRIDRSDTLARWLGGQPTGASQDEGEVYAFELSRTPLTRGTMPWL